MVELYRQVKFPQALTLLHQWRGLAPLLHEAAGFYRMQSVWSLPLATTPTHIAFPLEGNLHGRSISIAAPPHRFLAGR